MRSSDLSKANLKKHEARKLNWISSSHPYRYKIVIQLHATVLRLIRTFHVERKWLRCIRLVSKCVSCAKGFEKNSHWKMSTLGHGQGPGHATLIPRLRDFTLMTRTCCRIFSSSCRILLAA